MNLPTFLKEVDKSASKMEKDKLLSAIHELARTLPENQRDTFLQTLKAFESSKKVYAKKAVNTEIADRIKKILKAFEEINEGNRYLEAEYNEEYDPDSYWKEEDEEEDEYIVHDETGILKDIRDAFSLVHECFDKEAYTEAVPLIQALCELKVDIEGDYDGETPCKLRDLEYAVDLDLSDYITWPEEMSYIMYLGSNEDNRAKNIYEVLDNFGGDCSLEDIMQTGAGDLPGFDSFLNQWVSYLGDQEKRFSDKLLKEAVSMIPTIQGKSNVARKVVYKHPEVYRDILLENRKEKTEMLLSIGLEALHSIPANYSIRGEIALLASDYAKTLKQTEAKERCWLEAFRSNTTPTNLLRLKLETEDYGKYSEEVKDIYEQEGRRCRKELYYSHDYMHFSNNNPVGTNSISQVGYCACLAFDGRIKDMVKAGLSSKDNLGWSGSFMKIGIAWLAALLYKGEVTKNAPKGIRTMLRNIENGIHFDQAEYSRGLKNSLPFTDMFTRYKETVEITEDDRKKYIELLENLITRRTDAIMAGSYRNYYGECAAFIAALGEVEESLGLISGKNVMMLAYRQQYNRRTAFHSELRSYGMDDRLLKKK